MDGDRSGIPEAKSCGTCRFWVRVEGEAGNCWPVMPFWRSQSAGCATWASDGKECAAWIEGQANERPGTMLRLKPGRVYRAKNDARYLSAICFDGSAATVTWARPEAGAPWQTCDAYEFRAWVRDSGATEEFLPL